jgi:hypothetical protein
MYVRSIHAHASSAAAAAAASHLDPVAGDGHSLRAHDHDAEALGQKGQNALAISKVFHVVTCYYVVCHDNVLGALHNHKVLAAHINVLAAQ